MILKQCRKCKIVIEYPNTYCISCKETIDKEREEAKVKHNKEANRKYNKKRDPKYLKFYGSMPWIITSKRYMQDKEYKCEECNKIAAEVHHIIPIQTEEGWEKRLDYYNLQALCLECHNKKHNRFKRTVRRKKY